MKLTGKTQGAKKWFVDGKEASVKIMAAEYEIDPNVWKNLECAIEILEEKGHTVEYREEL